ncbi:WD40-repeat-containing domain protein [Aspergillus aurantiobrunneus]
MVCRLLPSGQLLASGSCDKAVKLWNPSTGNLCQTLDQHFGTFYSVAFSPNGKLLASGSYDKTVRLWDPSTGTLCQTLKGHSKPAWAESNVTLSILDDQWICFGERRVFWLPPHYRPACLDFKAGILGLGSPSGRVFLISHFPGVVFMFL